MNSIDPRRLVSHEGDVEEAAREYEASKSAEAAKKKSTTDEAPKVADGDKSKTTSGVSYAEYAKNACTSDHRENCLNDGPVTPISFKPVTFHHEVGAQNELGVDVAKQEDVIGKQNGFDISLRQQGPSAGIHGGIHNEDGSTGLNLGVHAEAAGTGVRLHREDGAELVIDASAGESAGGSVGLRHENGGTQLCANIDVGMVNLGICLPFRN